MAGGSEKEDEEQKKSTWADWGWVFLEWFPFMLLMIFGTAAVWYGIHAIEQDRLKALAKKQAAAAKTPPIGGEEL